jgi:hypothetical protein
MFILYTIQNIGRGCWWNIGEARVNPKGLAQVVKTLDFEIKSPLVQTMLAHGAMQGPVMC